MTEEIIIDGVGCAFYNNGKCNNPNGMACNCINNAVCYYKQLQRLKQENETLNYQWHKQYEIADEWYKVAEKYKSTLEEIRKILTDEYYIDTVKAIHKIDEVLQ